MTAEECPFCKETIGKVAFFSTGGNIAVVNIAPVLPGHSLVIPSRHVKSMLELTEAEITAFFAAAVRTTRVLLKAFNTDAFDWSLQEKEEAGQSIEHLHLHIVPRLKNDLADPGDWYPLLQKGDRMIIDNIGRPKLSKTELGIIVAKLREVAATIDF